MPQQALRRAFREPRAIVRRANPRLTTLGAEGLYLSHDLIEELAWHELAANSRVKLLGKTLPLPHVLCARLGHHQASLDHRSAKIDWLDRRIGPQTQDIETAVGDFVVQRADECFTYQLAVVVDDAEQGISHVVRGEDLADNTARQIWLQGCHSKRCGEPFENPERLFAAQIHV
ncbi:MAG: hypothetical protein EBW55_01480 [Betaproteobacteria bacterium]|nr:hypothetical protein [Betaproteobacteria bacterium]